MDTNRLQTWRILKLAAITRARRGGSSDALEQGAGYSSINAAHSSQRTLSRAEWVGDDGA